MKQLLTDRTYLDKACEGTTMLLEAVRIGSLEMVKILIEMGADVNCSNGITTPLIDAIKVKSLTLVDYLLYSGADINAPDKKNKETPLFHAVTNSTPTDTSIIQYLLKRNDTLLEAQDGKKTALIYAVERDKTNCIACILLRQDLDVNGVDYKYSTALHVAAAKNRYQAAYLICHHPKIDFDKEDANGLKAYELSSSSSNRQAKTIVKVFAEKGPGELLSQEQLDLIKENGVDIEKLPANPFISIQQSLRLSPGNFTSAPEAITNLSAQALPNQANRYPPPHSQGNYQQTPQEGR